MSNAMSGAWRAAAAHETTREVTREVTAGAPPRLHPVMTDAEPTDAALVRRVLDGDAAAFATLVDRHAAACLRYATRMLGARADAEDVTQETFWRAHRALPQYEERQQFRAWLFMILANRCRTALRRRARRQRVVAIGLDGAPDPGVAPATAGAELRDDLARAIGALDPLLREAFVLHHVEQLGYGEMVAITGAGTSALKMRVKRACEQLRARLAEGRDAVGT